MPDNKNRKRLIDFGKRLLELNCQLSLGTDTLTPTNYTTEREKFFTSDTYNPQFIYPTTNNEKIKKELIELESELIEMDIPSDLSDYIGLHINAIKKDLRFVDTIGTADFADASNDIFHFEDIQSKEFLREMPNISFSSSENCKLQCAEEMAVSFRNYLEEIGLDYKVEVDQVNDHIVRVGATRLLIGSKVKRFCNNVNRLVIHEIESHILQRHNLAITRNPLLRLIPHCDSLLWGEGLAVYNEIQTGTITRTAYETYYYRVKAVEMLDKSFRDIYDFLLNYVSKQKAFMITYRVKRGMGDTSQPGGYAKDASYLLGYKTVKEYIEAGGDIEFLYVSRFPALGELLFDHDLLSHESILLPKYLQKHLKTENSQINRPIDPSPYLRQTS